MISVAEAQQLIREHTTNGSTISLDLFEAYGYAAAADIPSPIDFPSFKQSAMDGYAFRLGDWNGTDPLFVERELQAGDQQQIDSIHPGEAIRIFTGSKVPDEADTVVMQEHVERTGNKIRITNMDLIRGSHIRPIASQTKQGDPILKKGDRITAGVAGFIAGLGIARVDVYRKPSCIILTTGKELVKPGNSLHEGQVYESNSFALAFGLQQLHLGASEIMWTDDTKEETDLAIQQALEKADVLLITGGVSVGEYDFVSEALETNGVQKRFHKVKQKPGKPLYFGTKGDKTIFGLPGNPGSVLTCFYEYVVPCLRMKMGCTQADLLSISLPSLNEINKKAGLIHFLKGKLKPDGVEVLDHQESYKMNAFAEADCLIVVDEDVTHVSQGELVTVHLLNP